MKKILFAFFIVCFQFVTLSAASRFYKNSTGSDMVIAIPEARGINLSHDQEYFPVLIQTQLTDAIKMYSPITVVDRQNEDIIDKEIARAEDGSYSDNDYAEFGKKVNARFVLIAQIINTDESYTFSVRINETETNTTKFTYSDNTVTARTIKNGMAANIAVKDLLGQIGVELTSEGLTAINGGVDENTLKAQENLSRGINASKRGTTVEALQYYYTAAEYNINNAEINERLKMIQTSVSSGNLGDLARSEDEAYDFWVKTLSDAEEFFEENPPYAIVYSTKINRRSRTSEELKNKENTFEIKIGLVSSNNSKKTINSLKEGLNHSPEVVKDAIEDWPRYSILDDSVNSWLRTHYCDVTVQLINSVDKVIGEKNCVLNLSGPDIMDPDFSTVKDLEKLGKMNIDHVKSDDITDNLTIRISRVKWANKIIPTENIRITTVEELTAPKTNSVKNTEKSVKTEDSRNTRKSEKREEKTSEIKKNTDKPVKHINNSNKKLNKRNVYYLTSDLVNVDFENDYLEVGVTLGFDNNIFSNLFVGGNLSFCGIDDFDYFCCSALAECGISLGINKSSQFYYKYGAGYSIGDEIFYSSGFIQQHSIGLDIGFFEMEYAVIIPEFDVVKDKFSIGFVFNEFYDDFFKQF